MNHIIAIQDFIIYRKGHPFIFVLHLLMSRDWIAGTSLSSFVNFWNKRIVLRRYFLLYVVMTFGTYCKFQVFDLLSLLSLVPYQTIQYTLYNIQSDPPMRLCLIRLPIQTTHTETQTDYAYRLPIQTTHIDYP